VVFIQIFSQIYKKYALSSVTVDISADVWKPVERGVLIPIELDTSYLHVKTYSEVGSEDRTVIRYFDKEGSYAGGIEISFTSPLVEYKLPYCQHFYTPFPTTLPTTVNKVWTIEKRRYRTRVFCNGLVVLDIILSDSTCDMEYNSDWETYWERDVSVIKFDGEYDTASEQYRTGQL
jgi:hypothetical protein